jgi:membrane associated rhomboid family serine protease
MATCVCCNCKLPLTSIVDELCPECVEAMKMGLDRAPMRSAQPVPVGAPSQGRPVDITYPNLGQPVPSVPVRHPATWALILINFGIFVLCIFFTPAAMQKHAEWGMDWGPATLGGEWWRMFTSMFLHVGWEHLLGNMWCLWAVGKIIEQIFPKWTFLSLYILTGLAGNILSLTIHPERFSCGASGAIFGIIGVMFAALIFDRLPAAALRSNSRIWSLVFFTALSIFGGDTDPRINYPAHLGGFVSGLGLGALLCARLDQAVLEPMNRFEKRVFAGMSVFLVLCAISLRFYYGDIIPLSTAQQAAEEGRTEEAARIAKGVTEKRPADVSAHLFLARIYIDQKDYKRAESEIHRSLELDPENAYAWSLRDYAAYIKR